MFEEDGAREMNGESSLSLGGKIAVAFLLLVSLGGLLYFFITPVP